MKTLINKSNPAIRITAPEIEISKLFDGSKVYWIPSIHELCGSFSQDHWTLVEEEPESVVGDLLAKTPPAPIRFEQEQPEEICSKCVYHKKDDGYCYYPHGGMKRRINENGVYECTAFWEREQEEQKPAEWSEEDEKNIGKLHRLLVICQSEKKFIPTSEYEKLDKWLKSLRPQSKEEQKPVDLEKEIRKHTDLFQADIEYPLRLTAIKFYELGRKGGSK